MLSSRKIKRSLNPYPKPKLHVLANIERDIEMDVKNHKLYNILNQLLLAECYALHIPIVQQIQIATNEASVTFAAVTAHTQLSGCSRCVLGVPAF